MFASAARSPPPLRSSPRRGPAPRGPGAARALAFSSWPSARLSPSPLEQGRSVAFPHAAPTQTHLRSDAAATPAASPHPDRDSAGQAKIAPQAGRQARSLARSFLPSPAHRGSPAPFLAPPPLLPSNFLPPALSHARALARPKAGEEKQEDNNGALALLPLGRGARLRTRREEPAGPPPSSSRPC